MPQSDRVSALDPAQSVTTRFFTAARPGIWGVQHGCPKPFGPRVGEVQCLGDVPWRCRATAVKPDAAYIAQIARRVNRKVFTACLTLRGWLRA